MNSLQDLLRLPGIDHALSGTLTLVGVCSIRLGVILLLFPPADSGVMQPMIKTGVTLIFSLFIAYGQPASLIDSLHGIMLVVVCMREALLGLVIAMMASSVFWTAQGAGTFIDDLTGYNNVQITNANNPTAFTPTSLLFSQVATAVFWTLGGMTALLGALYQSYHWWPLMSSTPIAENILETFAMQQADSLMVHVAKLAAPLMLMLLLVDVGLALVSRAAPKLDLAALAQPIKGALTVLMLAEFVALFIEQMRSELTLIDLPQKLRAISQALAASAPSSR